MSSAIGDATLGNDPTREIYPERVSSLPQRKTQPFQGRDENHHTHVTQGSELVRKTREFATLR